MKKAIIIIFSFIMLFALLTAALPFGAPLRAYAAAAPSMEFDCRYIAASSKLIVTASLSNPDTAVSSGMFVLKYDSSKLSADSDRIAAVGDISIPDNTKYYSSEKGYIGADWYASSQIAPSANKTSIAVLSFDVKNDSNLSALKNTLSVCEDTDHLDNIGGYGQDGGILLCTDSSHTYSVKDGGANAVFNYVEASSPEMRFHGVFIKNDNKLELTASIYHPDNKVSSAMFILDYDSSVITTSSDNVSYLGNAKKARTYSSNSTSSGSVNISSASAKQIGADWYYDTALPASSAETEAVKIIFDVKSGVSLDQIKQAVGLSSNDTFINGTGYKNDGSLLICENGDIYFNKNSGTASANFTYEEKTQNSTTSLTASTSSSRSTQGTLATAATSVSQNTTSPSIQSNGDARTGDQSHGYLFAAMIIGFGLIIAALCRKNLSVDKQSEEEYR